MTKHCEFCREEFDIPPGEDEPNQINICDECFDMKEDTENPRNFEYMQYSDADPGL